jgi:Xaa-Pro aminopeptidase
MLESVISEAPGLPPAEAPELFRSRRERLLSRVGDGVVVVPSAPELLRSRDTEIRYRQASDFYYLTGFLEPQAVVVLTPHDPGGRFTLFLRPRDPQREVWDGQRLGVEAAAEALGADAVFPISELPSRLPELLRPASRIHYPLGAEAALDGLVAEALIQARRTRQRTGIGPIGADDLEDLTGPMRRVKDPLEIERLRVAGWIAAQGHLAAMRRAAPGVGEWEMEAALESTFRALGASGPAFPSIVGAGANATVLHYVSNDSRAAEGDLVLIDAGAQWGMYCSDITRTFPVSGSFGSAQRELYEVVLAAEEAGILAATVGSPFAGIHDASVRVLVEGMLSLGILPPGDPEEIVAGGGHQRFFMHQTSHWLGLDVHDVGLYREADEPITLQPGMVLTIEPGLYIPADADDVPAAFRGTGIRIEDDVLITPTGNELLTRDVPVAIDDVEAVMRA